MTTVDRIAIGCGGGRWRRSTSNAALVTDGRAITGAFESDGYRRVGAEDRHSGFVSNAEKARAADTRVQAALRPAERPRLRRLDELTRHPQDSPQAESLRKTLTVQGVHLLEYKLTADVAAVRVNRVFEADNESRLIVTTRRNVRMRAVDADAMRHGDRFTHGYPDAQVWGAKETVKQPPGGLRHRR